MSVTIKPAPIKRSLLVKAPQERAFEVFTAGFGDWWPLESHHVGAKPARTAIIEPRAGGRWFERDAEGGECDWGRVLDWDPPRRVRLAWQLDAQWKYAPAQEGVEVEVRFVSEGPDATRVELEHRGLEVYGEHAADVRRAIDSDDGWRSLLAAYAKAAGAAG
jgi:uncharacterized protein YndB with AHSA1/START domain